MKISIVTRTATTAAVLGAVLLGGAGVALADETPPTPPLTAAPVPADPQATSTTRPTVLVTPVPDAPRAVPATTAPTREGQVRAVPNGAPETGGGATATTVVDEPADATLPVALGGGVVALAAAGVLVAVRRRV